MFDLSSIPANVIIESATLSLYVFKITGSVPLMEVFSVSESWEDSVITYENEPLFDMPVATSDTVQNLAWNYIEVTGIVREMIGNPYSNFGFILASSDNVTHSISIRSSEYKNYEGINLRPRLILKYDDNTPIENEYHSGHHSSKGIAIRRSAARLYVELLSEQACTFSLFSPNGRNIISKEFFAKSFEINNPSLPPGVYLVNISLAGENLQKSVVFYP